MKPVDQIKEKDMQVKQLWDRCKVLGIEADIRKRWRDGIDHHPRAEEIFEAIRASDWAFGGDHFCWKSGGDGDNGEMLKYALSVWCELEDQGAEGDD